MTALNHVRVVVALLVREMITRYGRAFGGYAWAIFEPVAWIVLLSLLFSTLVRTPALGTNFPLFFASGYLTFHMYRTVSDLIGRSVSANKPLFYFPRVQILHAVVARYFLQLITGVAVSVICYGGIFLIYDLDVDIYIYPVLVANVAATILGLGVGMVNCILFALSKTWDRIFSLVNRPLLLISGVFFIPEKLPIAAQEFLFINPLIHLIGLCRRGIYPGYDAKYVDLYYVFGISVTLIIIGLVLIRGLRGRILDV